MSEHAERRPGIPRQFPQIAGLSLLSALVACSCSGPLKSTAETEASPVATAEPPQAEPEPQVPAGPAGKGSLREHPAQRAFVVEAGAAPRPIEIAAAEAQGLTVVDLSEGWVPYIFTDKTPGLADRADNLYRSRYVDLAGDRTDSAGRELGERGHNYLELYGIPPTLSVVLRDFDEAVTVIEPCLVQAGFDPEVFERYRKGPGTLAYERGDRGIDVKKGRWYRVELDRAIKKAKLDPADEAAIADHAKTRALWKRYREHQDRVDVVDHAQRRFRCERMYPGRDGDAQVDPGVFDSPTTHALATFEKKHDVMGWGHFTPDNLRVLAQSPTRAAYDRLVRVIEERVVSATGIVEDGSAARWKKDFRWTDEHGTEHALRDMVAEVRTAALAALGFERFEGAHERLRALGALAGDFSGLLVAMKLPALPGYYADDMDFEVVIDRGEVWYDLPFDDLGAKLSQPRRRYPHLTLYVHHRDQRIPLVHWRTTIGSWRSELLEGQVYLKYKNSDVGARVWKEIVAAPVWIPPASTPPTDFLDRVYRDGKLQWAIDYGETGPGYESAYGLVAAYHIRQVRGPDGEILRELDNQIRTHGSVDYMSILKRYSHGCHRLYNMEAVRMFSFILRHRDYARAGQEPIGFRRAFDYEGQSFRLVLDTRGYKYELTRPIPVMVTEGKIRGKLRKPLEEHVPKPGVVYDAADTDGISTEPGLESSPDAAPIAPEPPLPPG